MGKLHLIEELLNFGYFLAGTLLYSRIKIKYMNPATRKNFVQNSRQKMIATKAPSKNDLADCDLKSGKNEKF